MSIELAGDERQGRRLIFTTGYRWFVRVTLDRDAFVDRSRFADYDASLAPGFAEAAERCAEAGLDRLRVSAPVGDLMSSVDDRYVVLDVPYEYLDEAVEALKTAELDGKLASLEHLTAKLRVPFDEWFAPGERTLLRGRDFTCSAYRLREVLRSEAKARGLMLNARITGADLRVRPQPGTGRSRVAKPRSPRTVKIHFPGTLQAPDACACGLRRPWDDHNSDRHDKWHSGWSVGVPVPLWLQWHSNTIAVVEDVSPYWWRRLAYECALVAKRDGGYDFASFPVPTTDPEPEQPRLRAYLCKVGQRVVGYLSTSRREGHRWLSNEDGEHTDRSDTGIRPSVDLIFVADSYRRTGIASALLAAYAHDENAEVTDLSWSWPVSPKGRALAAHHTETGFWVNA